MRYLIPIPALLLTGAAMASDGALTLFSSAPGDQIPAPWRVVGVPGGKIPLTTFALKDVNGRKALQITASRSYGNLVHDLPPSATPATLRLRWSWQLAEALPGADLRVRQGDDSPLKVCVLFDLPLEKLGLIERNLLRLARAATRENLPTATLCYVWDEKLEPETLLSNAYTARVRMIVTTQGSRNLNQWVSQSRDLRADFLRAFGHETDTVPAIQAVLVGGDSDNTGGRSVGYVSDVLLEP